VVESLYYLSRPLRWSAVGCVAVDAEQLGQSLLGGVHIGEDALGAGRPLPPSW
jgi:hypothetical protein